MMRELWGRIVGIGVLVLGLTVFAVWPVTTRFGVNYQWSSKRITLFEKSVHFISRDLQARRLAAEVTSGASSDEEKLVRMFEWTIRHVQSTPPGFPVVDDHVMYIILRGYGAPDQRTEAFTLLASYAGFPATAAILHVPGTDQRLIVAVVRDRSRTFLFDINHQILFRTSQGRLADLDDLMRDRRLVSEAAHGLTVDGRPYEEYFAGLRDLRVTFSRMEAQKLWPRLRQEVLGMFGIRS